MKNFFTKKRIAFLSILCISLLILIILLIVPISSLKTQCYVYSTYTKDFGILFYDEPIFNGLTSPFTFGSSRSYRILVWQTVIFTLIGIVFVVFLALFIIELKKAGAFTHRPTKAERLQQQVDDLQKQIYELKKGE